MKTGLLVGRPVGDHRSVALHGCTGRGNWLGCPRHSVRRVDAVEDYPKANLRIVEASEVVVLAISPDRVPSVLDEISSSLRASALVISLAAGVTLSRLTSMLPKSATVVRVIPNLGGQVGFGVTGVGQNEGVSEEQLRVVHELFSTVGKVVTVRDDQLDAVSSLSGSGPAYF